MRVCSVAGAGSDPPVGLQGTCGGSQAGRKRPSSGILVLPACQHSTPRQVAYRPQRSLPHILEVKAQDGGMGRFGLVRAGFLVHRRPRFSVSAHGRRGEGTLWGLFHQPLTLFLRAARHGLIASHRPHLRTPSSWTEVISADEHKHTDHSKETEECAGTAEWVPWAGEVREGPQPGTLCLVVPEKPTA